MTETTSAVAVILEPNGSTDKPKRKPGRPKGYPRSGGRLPGTANKITQLTQDFIIRRGAPIEILCKIAKGERVMAAEDSASATKRGSVFPTIDQRLLAARILAAKVLPDLKSVGVSNGGERTWRMARPSRFFRRRPSGRR